MTARQGHVFPCCGYVKKGGTNHNRDVVKTSEGWKHNMPQCEEVILMEFPEVMEVEPDFHLRHRMEKGTQVNYSDIYMDPYFDPRTK